MSVTATKDVSELLGLGHPVMNNSAAKNRAQPKTRLFFTDNIESSLKV
jgi:hypothetical protein